MGKAVQVFNSETSVERGASAGEEHMSMVVAPKNIFTGVSRCDITVRAGDNTRGKHSCPES